MSTTDPITSPSVSAEARREARLAAVRARRAGWAPTEEVEVRMEAVRPGDFVVKIPTQEGVRGLIIDSTVQSVDPDYSWKCGRNPVWAWRLSFSNGTATSAPSLFRVIVRRPVAS